MSASSAKGAADGPMPGVLWVKAPAAGPHDDVASVEAVVREVVEAVRARGDDAVRELSERFDGVRPETLEIGEAERLAAVDGLEPQAREDMDFAIDNVRRFAEAQLGTIRPLEIETLPGVRLGHRLVPIERVGCYVPGGRFPLLSAPLMSVVPAAVAGVDEIVACLPPNAHPAMLAGCHLSGAHRVFRIGGAQAIAAMAHGTESVPAVDKIVGPGNAWVNEAKRQVFGRVGIDQLAGPSEIFVVADATGEARTIATDLLAQAEHDPRTRVGLITTSRALAEGVLGEIDAQLATLPTASVAGPAWRDRGEITLAEDESAMIRYSDAVAAEHLQVHTADAEAFSHRLRHYGSLFVGEWSSVVYSDKCAGTNHTLPTMGAGRHTGGLWVGTYLKIVTVQTLDERGARALAPSAARQSANEGLEGHRRAAALRLEWLQAHDR